MVYVLWACEKNIYFALVACSIKSQLDPVFIDGIIEFYIPDDFLSGCSTHY